MNKDLLYTECNFKAVRSSGPGGQHVNKTSTKVVLSWSLELTTAFDEIQKERLEKYLATKLTKDRILFYPMIKVVASIRIKRRFLLNLLNYLKRDFGFQSIEKRPSPRLLLNEKGLIVKKNFRKEKQQKAS